MKIKDIHNIEDFLKYEKEQFRKAFYDGENTAWTVYKRNMRRAEKQFTKETGYELDRDALASELLGYLL